MLKMKRFSVPADFKCETLEKYNILNKQYEHSCVSETYGSITVGSICGSGRSASELPVINLKDLETYLDYSSRKGINFNYTMNAPFMLNEEFSKDGLLKIKHFLRNLYNIGVNSLTVAMPSLIEIIKSQGYDFHIKLSAIANARTPNMAKAYKEMGIEGIVVPEFMQRDFKTLKRIRDVFGEGIEIILNTICHKDCIYRQFHYNQLSQGFVETKTKIGDN